MPGGERVIKVGDLAAGDSVTGVLSQGPVTLLAVQHHSSQSATVTFKDAQGVLGQALLSSADEQRLSVVTPTQRWTFDADGADFRLAAEAQRMQLAALSDPMLAISTSDLEPLPHQIRVVYEEMLPRSPLRFLLADDPGAGKTISAGLYAKELALRGDLQRCLVVMFRDVVPR